MFYSGIKAASSENGVGLRTSFFVSGCRHHCPGCFNSATWSFNNGQEYTEEVEEKVLKSLEPRYVSGLTVLGGEPLEIENQPVVLELIRKVKNASLKRLYGFIQDLLGKSFSKVLEQLVNISYQF